MAVWPPHLPGLYLPPPFSALLSFHMVWKMPTLSLRFLVPSCFKVLLVQRSMYETVQILKKKKFLGECIRLNQVWGPLLEVLNKTGIMEQTYGRVNPGDGEMNGSTETWHKTRKEKRSTCVHSTNTCWFLCAKPHACALNSASKELLI